MQFTISDRIYTVTELTRNIKEVLEETFGHVWVCGEVSNYRRQNSGHIYFTLKDEQSQLNIVFFRTDAARLKFKLEDGLQLNVEGRIGVYEKRGSYQLIALRAEPVGYGALQLAFEQLKKRLGEEGLFDEAHKVPIPRFPLRIGIVTSPTGAAIRDILHVIDRRFSTVEVVLYPSAVQGEGAAQEIAAGIKALDMEGNVDVIIVGRGGGSLEDLWAFNEELVARAIYGCATPIVSAVGHETDFTIADFVADLRAPTPSAAAELVVEEREAVISEIAQLHDKLFRSVVSRLRDFEHRLKLALSSYGFRRPADMVGQYELQLDDIRERIVELQQRRLDELQNTVATVSRRLFTINLDKVVSACRDRLRSARRALSERMLTFLALRQAELGEWAAKLNSLSPLAVLARGYSVTYLMPSGKILRESSGARPGDRVRVRLHRGSLECQVEKVED